MPSRFVTRAARDRGPQPFSSAWLTAPPASTTTRPLFTLPGWLPDEKALSAGLVLVLAVVIALATAYEVVPRPAAVAPAPTGAGRAAPTHPPQAALAAPGTPTPVAAPAFVAEPVRAATPALDQPPGALLPANRILTYYGHPYDPNMGILGEYPKEELLARLRAEAANYEAVDPTRPVIPAFEIIATVAQRAPMADGSYLLDTDPAVLSEYADFAAANGAIVILDLQIGRSTVAAEIEKVRSLLERPNVHLALDPEFAVAEGQIPGEYIGSLDAESVAYAQRTLAEIVAARGLPPKVLIVHQFREDMIANKMTLAPVPGVQLVIDADGYGAPELKVAVYNILVRDEPIEFAGIKLFYKQDVPLLTPAEVLALSPPPDVVIYQ